MHTQRDIDITDLSFGDFPPSVQRIQLVQSSDMNEELLVVRDARCAAGAEQGSS